MMKSINTTHIVKLLAIVSKNNPAYLILEFMDKGDLKDYLKSFKAERRRENQVFKKKSSNVYELALEFKKQCIELALQSNFLIKSPLINSIYFIIAKISFPAAA